RIGHVVETAPEAQVLDGAELGIDERLVREDADGGAHLPRLDDGADAHAAAARPNQRRQDADERRLAGAVWPHERGELAGAKLDGHAAERAVAAVDFGDPLDPDGVDHDWRALLGRGEPSGASRSSSWRCTRMRRVMMPRRWLAKASASMRRLA